MRHKQIKKLGIKAASAALAFVALSPSATISGNTIPKAYEEDLDSLFSELEFHYRYRESDTPLLASEFISKFPSSSKVDKARLMLADWYFFNKEYPFALKYYSMIPDGAFSGDEREAMLYRKAYSMIKTGFYDEASRYLKSILSSREFGDDARFYIAYTDYVKGDYDTAYREFVELKKRHPRYAEAEYYINQIDYKNGEYRKVANTSERLLSGGEIPSELKAETMRVGGLSFFKLGDKTTARNILSRYADLAGDGAEISALYSLASIYYDEGNPEKALPLFSVVTEYPGDLAQSAWLYIGQIYLSKGDSLAAALAFDKAAKESWDNKVAETAAYNLAVTSTEGMALPFSEATAAMENFIDAYPHSAYAPALSSYLANAYYARRDYENALRQIDRISNPDASTQAARQKILYQLGVAQMRQGNVPAAIQSLLKATSPSTDREVTAQAYLWLGDAYYSKKEYTAATKAYENAVANGLTGENAAIAKYNLGYAWMKLHNYTKAEKAFNDAISLRALPQSQQADARLRYADCLYYNGEYSKAMAIFKDISLDGGQDAVFARIREADILGKDGKVNEKITILENLMDSPDKGVWHSTILSRLADAYSEKGNDKKAAELYAMMLDSNPGATNDSQTYYSLATNAENLYKSNDKAAALSAYKRIEKSGISALYPMAGLGRMRTSTTPSEIMEYAAKAAALPGISPEEMNEALYLGAEAALKEDPSRHDKAFSTLDALARSSDRLWGAKAAVTLGEILLQQGRPAEAEEVLLYLIDNGSDDNYLLAKGYIYLADAYVAQDKDYLARLYLQTLQSNYPGKEKDIHNMINSRLKNLEQ